MRVPDGLAAWARLAGPATVLDEVRRRARRGHSTDAGALRVDLTPDRRREVARVLGVRWEASDRPVRLQDLSAALADHGLTVREFVEALDGAVVVEDRLVRSERDIRRDEERAAAGEELRGSASAARTWRAGWTTRSCRGLALASCCPSPARSRSSRAA